MVYQHSVVECNRSALCLQPKGVDEGRYFMGGGELPCISAIPLRLCRKEKEVKKLLIVLGLIVVLIGATYGGVALAAKPTGSPVVMETYSSTFQVTTSDGLALNFTETRHVSMTIHVQGLDVSGDNAYVFSMNYLGWGPDIVYLMQGDDGFYTFEFDAEHVGMNIYNTGGGNQIKLAYFITTTYPR